MDNFCTSADIYCKNSTSIRTTLDLYTFGTCHEFKTASVPFRIMFKLSHTGRTVVPILLNFCNVVEKITCRVHVLKDLYYILSQHIELFPYLYILLP